MRKSQFSTEEYRLRSLLGRGKDGIDEREFSGHRLALAAERLVEVCEFVLDLRYSKGAYSDEMTTAEICNCFYFSRRPQRLSYNVWPRTVDGILFEFYQFFHALEPCREAYRITLPSRERVMFSLQGELIGTPVYNGSAQELAALVESVTEALLLQRAVIL